ncbi:MAG TPA: hypothetical protein DER02_03625, partial [Gammaproteobacteria bacterium]|nr:hypothetical protein [Gammaproteobacteria bacterium]
MLLASADFITQPARVGFTSCALCCDSVLSWSRRYSELGWVGKSPFSGRSQIYFNGLKVAPSQSLDEHGFIVYLRIELRRAAADL